MLNGFAFYTTWTIIACLINLVQAWNYVDFELEGARETMKISCLVTLSILVLIHVTYFCIENLFCDRICRQFESVVHLTCTSNKTRYILTPYLVVVWATSAIYDKKTGPMEADDNIIGASIEQVNDYVLAIIIIAVLTFVIRAALVVMRTLKSPI